MGMPELRAEAVDATFQGIGFKTMVGGALTTASGWFLSIDPALLIGAIATIFGLVLQAIFGLRRDRRETKARQSEEESRAAEERRREELHQARLEAIRAGRVE